MGPHSRSVCEATFEWSGAESEGPELNIFRSDKMAGDIVWIVSHSDEEWEIAEGVR
jgi:hypothetical protein